MDFKLLTGKIYFATGDIICFFKGKVNLVNTLLAKNTESA